MTAKNGRNFRDKPFERVRKIIECEGNETEVAWILPRRKRRGNLEARFIVVVYHAMDNPSCTAQDKCEYTVVLTAALQKTFSGG